MCGNRWKHGDRGCIPIRILWVSSSTAEWRSLHSKEHKTGGAPTAKKENIYFLHSTVAEWLFRTQQLQNCPTNKTKRNKIGCLLLDSTWLLDDTDTMPKLLSGLIDHIALLYLQFLLCIFRQMCNMYYVADLQETRSVLITYPLINFYHYRQTNQVL